MLTWGHQFYCGCCYFYKMKQIIKNNFSVTVLLRINVPPFEKNYLINNFRPLRKYENPFEITDEDISKVKPVCLDDDTERYS